MVTFKFIREAIEYLKFHGYTPLELENATGYQPVTLEEVKDILLSGQDIHTTLGTTDSWEYFNLERE